MPTGTFLFKNVLSWYLLSGDPQQNFCPYFQISRPPKMLLLYVSIWPFKLITKEQRTCGLRFVYEWNVILTVLDPSNLTI
jgi:hypothetical protein